MSKKGGARSDPDLEQEPRNVLFCPSAQPGLSGSMILAVVDNSSKNSRISHLDRLVRVTDGTLLALAAGSRRSTELFRFAAPCLKSSCNNWSGSSCRVAQRLVQILPATANDLPDCKLRTSCRWHQQEGSAACLRCAQVVTEDPEFEEALKSEDIIGI
jgi:hypothetical protein